MFALGIEYLNGWAMATHPADRERAEWPPHPDRVFMALVAACMETDGGEDELKALEWMEGLGPPTILHSEATPRTSVTTFVPVNDERSPIKKGKALMPAGSMPIGRDRQARQFPAAIPDSPRVHLVWRGAEPSSAIASALRSLVAKVTSVGHSASMVQMWTGQDVPGADGTAIRELVPVGSRSAEQRLRVFGPGRLRQLRDRFALGLRPSPSLWEGYGAAPEPRDEPPRPHSLFGSDLLILRQTSGRRFGIESTLQLTEALRGAVMSRCEQPPPEWVSGHQPDGRPSQRTEGHLAFLPLPFVGRQHATGHLLGLAVAVPRDVPPVERSGCLGPVFFRLNVEKGEFESLRLTLGRHGDLTLQIDEGGDDRQALQSETWTRGSRRWGTVTPIALDRHAKAKSSSDEIAESIAVGCERIGLPRPADVIPTGVSLFEGVPVAREMPRIARKGGTGLIRHVHAVITFEDAIEGPVLIGAGRYRGYGFCRPLNEESD